MQISDFNERVQRQIREQLARQNAGVVRAVSRSEPEQNGNRAVASADWNEKGSESRVVVSLVGMRRRIVDDDNFIGGCKYLRDAIADSLGIDDGDKRIRFEYSQLQTNGAEGVLVKIEC